jgi:hypothetical protein
MAVRILDFERPAMAPCTVDGRKLPADYLVNLDAGQSAAADQGASAKASTRSG